MDSKDRRILSELLYDSRIPLSQLAKRVKVSREVLAYRLRKLEKDVIKQYSSQISIKALGFQRTGCYVTLQNCLKDSEEGFIRFLENHRSVAAISTNIGRYDVIFDIFYRDSDQLHRTLLEIESFLGDMLYEIFFLNLPIEQGFFYGKLLGQKSLARASEGSATAKVDATDKMILRMLNRNARESLVSIASKVGLKANAVGYRIRALEERGVLMGSTVFIDFESLGFDLYNIQLKVGRSAEQGKVLSFLRSCPNVFYFYHYFGNSGWDIDVGVAIRKKEELKSVVQELKSLPVGFREMYMIEKVYKEELPEGVFL